MHEKLMLIYLLLRNGGFVLVHGSFMEDCVGKNQLLCSAELATMHNLQLLRV